MYWGRHYWKVGASQRETLKKPPTYIIEIEESYRGIGKHTKKKPTRGVRCARDRQWLIRGGRNSRAMGGGGGKD